MDQQSLSELAKLKLQFNKDEHIQIRVTYEVGTQFVADPPSAVFVTDFVPFKSLPSSLVDPWELSSHITVIHVYVRHITLTFYQQFLHNRKMMERLIAGMLIKRVRPVSTDHLPLATPVVSSSLTFFHHVLSKRVMPTCAPSTYVTCVKELKLQETVEALHPPIHPFHTFIQHPLFDFRLLNFIGQLVCE